MKYPLLAAVLAVLSPTLAFAETRSVGAFQEVNVADRIAVSVASGSAYAVEVTGDDAARVRTRVENGVLKISDLRRPWFGSGPRLDATVTVTAPAIEALTASRGATLSATLNDPSCTAFSARAAMGASLSAAGLSCGSVTASAAMGAEIELSGSCREVEVSAAMGAQVRAEDLHCETADVSAAMGADVGVFASQSYDASAAMGGAINVAGGPALRERSTAMGGAVRDR